ncbi:MAG: nitrilase-related carbon-nitrogen hydrolase [Candidatus Ornithomonoglobus sp.]
MKTAVFQTEIIFENKDKNLKRALELIKTAAEKGAEICFFPEMSFTGFSMNIGLTGESGGFTIECMKRVAAENNIAVGFGYVRLNNGRGENHYAVADKNGNILSDYVKIHSFAIGGEREDFESGNTLPTTVSTAGHKISTFICYDLRFPEIFRAVTDTSTVITIAANWPASRRGHWITLLKARAIENQAYIIGINCCGEQDGLSYSGDSMIIDPLGNVIAQAEPYKESMLLADIPADVEKKRAEFPVLASRKKELYKKLAAL